MQIPQAFKTSQETWPDGGARFSPAECVTLYEYLRRSAEHLEAKLKEGVEFGPLEDHYRQCLRELTFLMEKSYEGSKNRTQV